MMSMFRARKPKDKAQPHSVKVVGGTNHAAGNNHNSNNNHRHEQHRTKLNGAGHSTNRVGLVSAQYELGNQNMNDEPDVEASNGRHYIPLIVQTKPLTLAQSRDVESVRLHLRLCAYVYDFNNKDFTCQEIDSKRSLLIGLVEYISCNETVIGEDLIGDVIEMIKANIFRTLPPSTQLLFDGMDEDEPRLEKSWPHLQIVYEFLLRLVISSAVEDRIMKNYINRDFIGRLMPLFRSEDCRERDYLKNILHRIYGKYMIHRSLIRKEMREIFLSVIYEHDHSKLIGLAELLEILGSIVNGFALPLKEEHKEFLLNVLIPLHKVNSIAHFHQQLMYCINQYVEKDNSLATVVVEKLLSFWPVSNSPKQILFLYELEDILEITHSNHEEIQKFIEPLFKRIKLCLDSSHFQLAERALCLWQNDCVLGVIQHFQLIILPLVLNSIREIATTHWNITVVSLATDVRRLHEDFDPNASQTNRTSVVEQQERVNRWEWLESNLSS